MKPSIILFIIFYGITSPVLNAQNQILDNIKWQNGESMTNIGDIADIKIPTGYRFTGATDTRKIMEAFHNPTSGHELGFIAPSNEDWFILFEFNNTGYIPDDEKNSLDADAMLKSIKEGNEAGNQERQKRGWPKMNIVGWEQMPHYDDATHNLEWAIKCESVGNLVVNYNTRILGRQGVMVVTLVADPTTLSKTIPNFKNVLSGFDFKEGKRYAEFRKGDKVAEYGLTALITGGAAAVAVKTGLFKWLWKIILFGFVAVAGFFKKIFSGKK